MHTALAWPASGLQWPGAYTHHDAPKHAAPTYACSMHMLMVLPLILLPLSMSRASMACINRYPCGARRCRRSTLSTLTGTLKWPAHAAASHPPLRPRAGAFTRLMHRRAQEGGASRLGASDSRAHIAEDAENACSIRAAIRVLPASVTRSEATAAHAQSKPREARCDTKRSAHSLKQQSSITPSAEGQQVPWRVEQFLWALH